MSGEFVVVRRGVFVDIVRIVVGFVVAWALYGADEECVGWVAIWAFIGFVTVLAATVAYYPALVARWVMTLA